MVGVMTIYARAKAGLVHLRIWVTKEQAEAIMAIIEADAQP